MASQRSRRWKSGSLPASFWTVARCHVQPSGGPTTSIPAVAPSTALRLIARECGVTTFFAICEEPISEYAEQPGRVEADLLARVPRGIAYAIHDLEPRDEGGNEVFAAAPLRLRDRQPRLRRPVDVVDRGHPHRAELDAAEFDAHMAVNTRAPMHKAAFGAAIGISVYNRLATVDSVINGKGLESSNKTRISVLGGRVHGTIAPQRHGAGIARGIERQQIHRRLIMLKYIESRTKSASRPRAKQSTP